MPTYFAADLHLAHPKIAGLRGFHTVAAHDTFVMQGLYMLDPDEDELWLLGDLSSNSPESMWTALDMLDKVPVPKHAVLGNHDPGHSMHPDHNTYRGAYSEVFDSVQEYAQISVLGEFVTLSHFPYLGTPDRYSRRDFSAWQTPDEGGLLVHGHTHSREPRSGSRSVCVSMEAWGMRPAEDTYVMAEMAD